MLKRLRVQEAAIVRGSLNWKRAENCVALLSWCGLRRRTENVSPQAIRAQRP